MRDVAYDIDDECGERGDEFMRRIDPISSRIPYVFSVGDHEGGRKEMNSEACSTDYEVGRRGCLFVGGVHV